MITLNRKLYAAVLALAVLFTVAVPASADHLERRGSSKKEKITYIVGGAVAGALIGGLAKGKKGAAIGAAIGAGAGAATIYIKDRRERDRYEDDDYYYDDDDYRYRRDFRQRNKLKKHRRNW